MWIWVRRRFSSVYVAYSWCLCVSKDTFNQSLEVMSWFGVLFYPCPLVSFQCLLCSSLCLFPFLLVVFLCLSARLLCAFPSLSDLSSSLPSHLTFSSSGHQCVCVYSICIPCTPCQFVFCDVPLEFLMFPPVSPVSWWYVLDFWLLMFAFWFEHFFWLYFALALVISWL